MGLGGATPLLTARDVALWLQIPFAEFIGWHDQPGRAPQHIHVAGRLRWQRSDVEAWLVGAAGSFETCQQCAGEVDGVGVDKKQTLNLGTTRVGDHVIPGDPSIDRTGLESEGSFDAGAVVDMRPPIAS